MTKNDYREFFANVKPFIRFRYFCDKVKISPINLSRFMKGNEWDYEMSLEKCRILYEEIVNTFENIA